MKAEQRATIGIIITLISYSLACAIIGAMFYHIGWWTLIPIAIMAIHWKFWLTLPLLPTIAFYIWLQEKQAAAIPFPPDTQSQKQNRSDWKAVGIILAIITVGCLVSIAAVTGKLPQPRRDHVVVPAAIEPARVIRPPAPVEPAIEVRKALPVEVRKAIPAHPERWRNAM